MKLSRLTLAALALSLAAPFAASAADGVSYTYVQGGYVSTNTDGGDADGWGLKGSAALNPNFHVFGDFANQTIDDSDIDFDQWRVGVGYNRAVSQRADLVTRWRNGELKDSEARTALSDLNRKSIMTPELEALIMATKPADQGGPVTPGAAPGGGWTVEEMP